MTHQPPRRVSKRALVIITTLAIIIAVFLTYAFWYVPTSRAFADYRSLEKWTIDERAIIESNMLYITKADSVPSKTIVEEYDHSGTLLFVDTVRTYHRADVWEVSQTHSDLFFGTVAYSIFYFSDDGQMWVLNCDEPWHPLK